MTPAEVFWPRPGTSFSVTCYPVLRLLFSGTLLFTMRTQGLRGRILSYFRISIPVLFLGALIIAFNAQFVFAQTPTPTPEGVAATTAASDGTTSSKASPFFKFDALTIGTRYHFIRTANDRITANNFQWQVGVRAHLNLDRKGRYAIHAGIFTGNVITIGWNNTGLGTGSPVTNIYLKQLYFDANPVKGFEVKIGGFAPDNGENTEVTGYDNDTYMMGERISVRLPKRLYFDEISATNGYFGDFAVPNVFRRFKRMGRSNYHQFMVRKRLNKFVAFSSDYTFDSGVDILREGVKVTGPKSSFVDLFQFEMYERLDPSPGYGLNIYAQKNLKKHVAVGGGYARIDRSMINSDRFPRGNRLYLNWIVTFNKELSVTTALTQGIGPIQSTLPRTRLDITFAYNFFETLRRKKAH